MDRQRQLDNDVNIVIQFSNEQSGITKSGTQRVRPKRSNRCVCVCIGVCAKEKVETIFTFHFQPPPHLPIPAYFHNAKLNSIIN